MQKTSKFIISILIGFCIFSMHAQNKKFSSKSKALTPVKTPFIFKSLKAELDVAPLVSTFIDKNGIYSYEGSLQADLNKTFFPVVELGLSGANKFSLKDINYKADALFGRIGVDFNLMKPKPDAKPTNNQFLAGVRLGMTNFNYNITNINITDDYWGENQTLNYSKAATKFWFEVVAGIHVEIVPNVYMGWTVRNKSLLGSDISGLPAPWYIPGFGITNSASGNWGFTYTVGYKFNFKSGQSKTTK